jgi:hypothetical protein
MMFSAKVTYTKDIVKAGALSYWKKKFGKEFYWIIPALIAGVIIIWKFPAYRLFGVICLVVSSIAVIAISYAYFVHLRKSLRLLSELGVNECEWSFNDEGLSTKSAIGESRLKWLVVERILKFPRYWLFVYKGGTFSTLPISSISQECRDFIERSHSASLKRHSRQSRAN